MFSVAVGSKAGSVSVVVARSEMEDDEHDRSGQDCADHLRGPIEQHVVKRHTLTEKHSQADRWSYVTPGNRSERVGHGHQRYSEGQSDSHDANLSQHGRP